MAPTRGSNLRWSAFQPHIDSSYLCMVDFVTQYCESTTLLLTSVTEPLLTDAGEGGGVINHITASLGSYVNERNR